MPCARGDACSCPKGRSREREFCADWTPGHHHRYYFCIQWQTSRTVCHLTPRDQESGPRSLKERNASPQPRTGSLLDLCKTCPFHMKIKVPVGRPAVNDRLPGETQVEYRKRRRREAARAERARLDRLSQELQQRLRHRGN